MSESTANIFSVARRLVGYREKFEPALPEIKLKGASLCERISKGLEELDLEIKRDTVPHELCRELIVNARDLGEVLSDILDKRESDRLLQPFFASFDVEKLLLEFRTSTDKKHKSTEMMDASNLFKALANGIRTDGKEASPPFSQSSGFGDSSSNPFI